MTEYKLRSKRKPELMPNGRVKRTGATYYEVNYIKNGYWTYREFNSRKEATSFIEGLN
jgi:hypothetical protein